MIFKPSKGNLKIDIKPETRDKQINSSAVRLGITKIN